MPAHILYRQGRVNFRLRLTPKGGRDAVEGWTEAADGTAYLKARVAAVPEDGKANTALIALLSKALAVSKSSVHIASGAHARLKTVEIVGDAKMLGAKLESLGDTG